VNQTPSLDDAVQLAESLPQQPLPKGWRRDPARQFRVRHFAGPQAHVDQLTHLRVAHLTDLHVGRMTPVRIHETAVQLTNAERPDLVVITGDFVCHSQLYLDELSAVVAAFEAPVVAVLGNHDYWSGANEVRWALRRGGAEVLDNRNTVITMRHQRLQLVGVDDAYTGHAAWRDAVKGMRLDLPTLGLSHIAEEADALWQSGVPLVLSGHTHAGQVTLAKLHELAVGKLAGHRYVHGLYGARSPEQGNGMEGAVYVGAGVGAAVVPLRIGERARREITIFELGHEPGSFEEHHDEQLPLEGRKPSARKQFLRHTAVVKKAQRRLRRNGT
jgi:uncharacterized protein